MGSIPTTDVNNVFGRIISRRDVENAVVAFLQRWVPTYVAAMEQQEGLVTGTLPMPPDPDLSYRGGLDAETWQQSWSPCYIVVAQALSVERVGGEGSYITQFELKVHLNFALTSEETSLGPTPQTPAHLRSIEEDSARQYADILGMAACAAMVQHGGLGTWPDGSSVAIKSVLVQYPRASFPYQDQRQVVRSTFIMHAWVNDVVRESDGPLAPNAPVYALPGDWPSVINIDVNLTTYGASAVAPGSSSTARPF